MKLWIQNVFYVCNLQIKKKYLTRILILKIITINSIS